MVSFWRDLRFAGRLLLKSPGFTVVSVLCLALGIGANSTIFSLVDGYWIRPLPVRDPRGLVYLSTTSPRSGADELSFAEFLDYQGRTRSFSGLAAMERRGPTLTGNGFSLSTMSNVTSENYFALLGVEAQLGRMYTPADAESTQRVVVMSYNLWQRRFGANPAIIGQSVRLNGVYTVIGVAPQGFRGTELWQDSDFWMPMSSWDRSGSERLSREYRSYTVIGRLRPGVTLEAARAETAAVAAQLEREYPKSNQDFRAVLMTAREVMLQSTGYRPFLLLGIVGIVLLIACANLANLLLARAGSRAREFGVRLSMGAARPRLIAQLMAESALIGILGLAAGLLLAAWLISLLPAVIIPPANNYLHVEFRLDLRVLAFTLAVSLITILVFGLAPAWRASRTDVISVLKCEGSSGPRGRAASPRSVLVVVQVALSVMLLSDAGLLVRTFLYSMSLDLGFERRNILVADISPPYGQARSRVFYRRLLERVNASPGILQATLALRAPLSGSGGGLAQEIAVPGRPVQTGDPASRVKYAIIGLNYFRTLGIGLLRGRDFEAHDTSAAAPVMIINETMSRRFWPNDDPIGRIVALPSDPVAASRTVVGVVRDTRVNSPTEEGQAYFYLPYEQTRMSSMHLIAATVDDPVRVARSLRAEVSAVDPAVPVLDITTMKLLVRSRLYEQQVSATIVGGLGLLALLLVTVGLYGLISHAVTRRTREIGIRMAVGARTQDAMVLILRQGMMLVAVGVVVGLAAAAVAARALAGLVHGVALYDPLTFSGVVVVTLLAGLFACYLPASRATRIDPMIALRHE